MPSEALSTLQALVDSDVMAKAHTACEVIESTAQVLNDGQMHALLVAAKYVSDGKKALEDQLASITQPLREAEQAARALARPHLGKFTDARAHADKLEMGWRARAKQEAEASYRAEQAAALVAAEQRAEDDMPAVAVPDYGTPNKLEFGGAASYTRSTLTVSITDLVAVAREHPHLLKLDAAAAKSEYRALTRRDPDARIPGLTFQYEPSITRTGARQ